MLRFVLKKFLWIFIAVGVILPVVLYHIPNHSDEQLHQIATEGNKIISALENYKQTNGVYPNSYSLDELVPKFIRGPIPPEFVYTKPEEGERNFGEYEYQLRIRLEGGIFAEGGKYLVYRPSECYPKRRYEYPYKAIDKWAVIGMRYVQHYENVIEGPGICPKSPAEGNMVQ